VRVETVQLTLANVAAISPAGKERVTTIDPGPASQQEAGDQEPNDQ